MKPEISLGVGLATATLVYAIYNNATPNIADIRSLDRSNLDIASAERSATWTSAAIVSAISLMAKDATIFVVGGTMVVVMAWWTRHANLTDPTTGKVDIAVDLPEQTQAEAPERFHAPSNGAVYDSTF